MTSMELITVDPAEIIVDANVRTVVDIDPLFYESIRDHGVQQPPKGWRDSDGRVHVEVGQRRVLASSKAGLPEIPFLITSREEAQHERAEDVERKRIVDQLAENDHRAPLSAAEHVAAYHQLTLFGMSADEIAKSTKTKRDTVRTAVKLAKDAPTVVATLSDHTRITLDQAALIAEFDDFPDFRAELIDIAENEPTRLEHRAEWLRGQAEEQREHARLGAEIEAEGFRFIAVTELRGSNGAEFRDIEDVRIGNADEAPTVEQAREQGGLIVTLTPRWKPEGENGRMTKVWEREHWIESPLENGYRDLVAEDEDEEEDEAEAARAAEADAARRAAVAEREQKWRSAADVRERWITGDLLGRRGMPDQGLEVITRSLLGASIYRIDSWFIGDRLLGLMRWIGVANEDSSKLTSDGRRSKLLEFGESRGGTRHWVIALGLALVAAESVLEREPHLDQMVVPAAEYFAQLKSWGYGLSEIEQELVDRGAEIQDRLNIEGEAA